LGSKRNKKKSSQVQSGSVASEIKQVKVRPSSWDNGGSSVGESKDFFRGPVFEWLAIASGSLLAFWFLTSRIVGVQVSVLADEYLYVLDAHYNGLTEAKYPNYLFQWIYSSTKICGTDFYSCARSINAFFVVFGAIFIYLIAKQIGRSKWIGALAAGTAILGSYGTYTAYFMPEAIFNSLMMVFFWALIRFGNSDNLLVWVGIGTSLGIASLAKPHGLFVVPAIVIFVILWTRASKDKWLVKAMVRSAVFVGAVVGSKFIFGYLLAGERALSLFGLYGTLESITQGAASTVATSVSNETGVSVFFTGWGQTLMVTMIIGLALAVAIHGFILGFKKSSELFEQIKFRALMGIALLNMMGAIAMFEAIINFDVWMHTRYYTYLIPLAIIVLVEALRNQEQKTWPWAKYTVVAIFVSLSIYNLITKAAPYSSNWIDAPDFRAHIDNPTLSRFTILVAIVAAIIWLKKTRIAMGIALVVAVLLSIFSGAHNLNFLRTTFGEETAYEHVARVLRDFMPQEELDRAVLVGQNEMLQRTVFSSLTGSATILGTPEGGLDRSDLEGTKAWLIAIGESPLKGFGEPAIRGLGYNMYSLDASNSLTPKNKRVVDFTNQCSGQENLAWACGAETAITLDKPFPPNANVDLIFELSVWAADYEVELVLGESVIAGRLSPGLNSVNVKFTNLTSSEALVVRSKGSSAQNNDGAEAFLRPVWGLSNSSK
jgi:phosphoglycerol transferase